MLRNAPPVLLVSLLALFAASCGPADKKASATHDPAGATTGPAVDNIVLGSGLRFGQSLSWRISFVVKAPGLDGTIEGDAAYRLGNVVYSRTTVNATRPEDRGAALFLPPDLYLQRGGDGAWFVQSPWNQGMRPGQEENLGLDAPIISYVDVTQHLRQVEEHTEVAADGRTVARFHGTIDEADLAGAAPSGSTATADVDIWLEPNTSLPTKVVIEKDGEDGYTVTVEFADYDTAIAPPAAPQAAPLRDAQFPDAPCIGDQLAGCLAAQEGIEATGDCGGSARRVCLAPLGQIPPAQVDALVAYYRKQYGLTVTVLTPAAIPASLEDPLRQQIDASGLIDYMGGLFPAAYGDSNAVLIGLTVVDLYDSTSTFRYVFGVKGSVRDPKAVVSTLRMDPRFYSEAQDDELLASRARKLLSKYIGLLYYGLPPSSDPASPMFDSILGPADVDRMKEPLPVH
jgi:predicted Zn-dependent protease